MKNRQPTSLTGDKLRKAVDEYSELQKNYSSSPKSELIAKVSKKYDLSPLEHEFLLRQLVER